MSISQWCCQKANSPSCKKPARFRVQGCIKIFKDQNWYIQHLPECTHFTSLHCWKSHREAFRKFTANDNETYLSHSVPQAALDPWDQALGPNRFVPVDFPGNKFPVETDLQWSQTFGFCSHCWWACMKAFHAHTMPGPNMPGQCCSQHHKLEQKLPASWFLSLTFCFGYVPVSCTTWEHYSMDKMSSAGLNTGKKNAYKAMKVDPDEDYSTPGAFELERLFWKGCPQYTHVNEVWPNLYIGDE